MCADRELSQGALWGAVELGAALTGDQLRLLSGSVPGVAVDAADIDIEAVWIGIELERWGTGGIVRTTEDAADTRLRLLRSC